MQSETSRAGERVEAGWYPDPLGHPQLRWWNNHEWTEYVSASRPARPAAETAPPEYAEPPQHQADGDGHLATRDSSVAPDLSAAAAPEVGWAGAALTLHSVLAARVPMLIELAIAGHPSVRVDTRFGAFTWDLPLTLFPTAPAGVRVGVELIDVAAPPVFLLPGQSLDELLWRIGLCAFPDRIAPWLQPGQRYRLSRWPNLSTLQPTMEQMRQTAMLANSVFSLEELAHATGSDLLSTRHLINAYSLIGCLDTLPSEVGSAPAPGAPSRQQRQASAVADRDRGLFRRLRDKLGL
ncbi:DUF2510 domain-containing protein [Salinibacterium sp. SYSU T00001]|uniref:DUF2510 domain-containing protein n=1 Tax=Homoserinimonas sedimenticola TaxID=2986805 RepID=UPI00223652EE|nr:DUF2510 domain-containing protein [Salinibacterium sedimenticola]MCW4386216.1 DUF2510 domain-containing protein [Salinibacterium sedimenticola]